MNGTKKLLSVALAGIVGVSILTSPVFAAAGGAGTDGDEAGNITVNYRSLTQGSDGLTNKVGPNNEVIDTDFGYAWDDLNFTYVQTVGGGESTLTTDGGYQETASHFISGNWYKGSYSTLEAFNAAETTDKVLPEISLVDAAMPGADVSAEEFANLPKIILHNYTQTSADYAFGVASEDVDKFNANGMLTFVNEAREACEVEEATGTLSGSGTCTYAVSPIGAPATKNFSPFNVGLTITIN